MSSLNLRSQRSQDSIDQYNNSTNKLDYLNLEFPERSLKNSKGINYFCFSKEHNHSPNCEDQLLLDLFSTSSLNQAVIFQNLCLLSRVSLKHFHSIQETLSRINQQLAELENQSASLKKFIVNRPTKAEVNSLISEIIEHPKKIEEKALQLTTATEDKLNKVEGLVKELLQHLV